MTVAAASWPRTRCWSVQLLGGFSVASGEDAIELPADAQRLVAFLALQPGRVPRAYVAGALWLDGSQRRAFGNLRSALWRVRQHATDLIDADTRTLGLASSTSTDVATLVEAAGRVSAGHDPGLEALDPGAFTRELLPGWYEDWVVVHRERVRQSSLHALEALADRLTEQQRYGLAIQAALAAIQLDPLRESPIRCLIRTHMAEGNYSEALDRYSRYRIRLHTELGIEPSPRLIELVDQSPVIPGDSTAEPSRARL